MYHGGWGPYIPVAQRRFEARRALDKLRKKGKTIYPVEIDGRTIARSFWGKGWCQHLESFMDYENRLPRGRTYVRNGSVCHLDIQPRRIDAYVSGSCLYEVHIEIDALPEEAWEAIKRACAGRIGSMLELLQGKLSNEVMTVVADRDTGLFPQPEEIHLSCDCPDWAIMCKHVAATLYGVGNRLDLCPELLFLLRDVDAQDLIAAEMALPTSALDEDVLAAELIGDVFGIDLEDAPAPKKKRTADISESKTRKKRQSARKDAADPPIDARPAKRGAAKTRPRKARNTLPEPKITGPWIQALREKYGMGAPRFAKMLGISVASVYRWEAIPGLIPLQIAKRRNLLDAWHKSMNLE